MDGLLVKVLVHSVVRIQKSVARIMVGKEALVLDDALRIGVISTRLLLSIIRNECNSFIVLVRFSLPFFVQLLSKLLKDLHVRLQSVDIEWLVVQA